MNSLKVIGLSLGLFCAGWSHAEDDGPNPAAANFELYKPMYFISGHKYTKIQLSIKTAPIRTVPLYFAYTQLMMWDTFIASPAFHDLNYNPELFYRFALDQSQGRWIDGGIFEHESNGKGGATELGWDRIYVRYHTGIGAWKDTKLHWDFKIWLPVRYNKDNPDLAQYRGLWELNITWTDFMTVFSDRADLTLRLYPGGRSMTNPFAGGQELTFRVKTPIKNFLPLFVAQVFHGYGENLSDYQSNHWGIRAGIGF